MIEESIHNIKTELTQGSLAAIRLVSLSSGVFTLVVPATSLLVTVPHIRVVAVPAVRGLREVG